MSTSNVAWHLFTLSAIALPLLFAAPTVLSKCVLGAHDYDYNPDCRLSFGVSKIEASKQEESPGSVPQGIAAVLASSVRTNRGGPKVRHLNATPTSSTTTVQDAGEVSASGEKRRIRPLKRDRDESPSSGEGCGADDGRLKEEEEATREGRKKPGHDRGIGSSSRAESETETLEQRPLPLSRTDEEKVTSQEVTAKSLNNDEMREAPSTAIREAGESKKAKSSPPKNPKPAEKPVAELELVRAKDESPTKPTISGEKKDLPASAEISPAVILRTSPPTAKEHMVDAPSTQPRSKSGEKRVSEESREGEVRDIHERCEAAKEEPTTEQSLNQVDVRSSREEESETNIEASPASNLEQTEASKGSDVPINEERPVEKSEGESPQTADLIEAPPVEEKSREVAQEESKDSSQQRPVNAQQLRRGKANEHDKEKDGGDEGKSLPPVEPSTEAPSTEDSGQTRRRSKCGGRGQRKDRVAVHKERSEEEHSEAKVAPERLEAPSSNDLPPPADSDRPFDNGSKVIIEAATAGAAVMDYSDYDGWTAAPMLPLLADLDGPIWNISEVVTGSDTSVDAMTETGVNEGSPVGSATLSGDKPESLSNAENTDSLVTIVPPSELANEEVATVNAPNGPEAITAQESSFTLTTAESTIKPAVLDVSTLSATNQDFAEAKEPSSKSITGCDIKVTTTQATLTHLPAGAVGQPQQIIHIYNVAPNRPLLFFHELLPSSAGAKGHSASSALAGGDSNGQATNGLSRLRRIIGLSHGEALETPNTGEGNENGGGATILTRHRV